MKNPIGPRMDTDAHGSEKRGSYPRLSSFIRWPKDFHFPVAGRAFERGLRPDSERAPRIRARTPTTKLAGITNDIITYFQKLARASDRILLTEFGKTAMGKPMYIAYISAPENLKKLDQYRQISRAAWR